MSWKIELITIPVSDVDRAKAFYVDKWASTLIMITLSTRGFGSCN
jgi:catechol 2,3-dioxygenase-like lactoylglutathione lyase family enzyme